MAPRATGSSGTPGGAGTHLPDSGRSSAGARLGDEVDVFWLAGMSCDGCSIALTGAVSPPLERLLRGGVGLPRITLHHPLFAVSSGREFLEPHRRALRGENETPYIVVLEGAATDEALAGDGFWAALGTGTPWAPDEHVVDGVHQPLATMEWVRALAPGALVTIAVGTCAAWGGVPAANGAVTGAMSLTDLLGSGYRSAAGLPIVNVPGCAPVGDNIVETLAALLLHLAGMGPALALDELGRPEWLYSETAHRRCNQVGFYEVGVFAAGHGEGGCLAELGCWGPVVQCNITTRGAINGVGGCMTAGGACIGCTMPGFPDRFVPFAGSASPTRAAVRAQGSALRVLPVVSEPARHGQTERRGPEPSGWTFAERPSPVESGIEPFYEVWRIRDERTVAQGGEPLARGTKNAGG